VKLINRHTALNREMGIGPVWKLNADQLPDASEHETAASALLQSPQSVPEPAVPDILGTVDAPDTERRLFQMDMPQIAQRVASCQLCSLCRGRRQTVFGTGDERATYLFVGEGPGYNENIQGQPFVGPAGQLLDNVLRALSISRQQAAYIANIVKCRPIDERGNDRPPSAEEIAACLPYLQRQIELIQPEIIIALGKTAAVSLLGLDLETPVGQLRGKVHRYRDIPLVVTYHPAYLLRKPIEKSKTWQDLCLANAALAASRKARN
jgi:uracil-DNA glycosylase family 4